MFLFFLFFLLILGNPVVRAMAIGQITSPNEDFVIPTNISQIDKQPFWWMSYESLAKWNWILKGKTYPKAESNLSTRAITMSQDASSPSSTVPKKNFPPRNFTSAPQVNFVPPLTGGKPVHCNPTQCTLPRCYCDARNIPKGLPAKQTPQMVLMTFDDSINIVNSGIISRLLSLNLTNPNGCPITSTFFLSNDWTDYKLVEDLYQQGHEFASHSMNHKDMTNYMETQWRDEIVGQARLIHQRGNVDYADIVGMRAPFLAIGGNTMFKMLWSTGFLYDSSISSQEMNPPLWPYTLDSELPHKCQQGHCPTGYFPSLWEVPMTTYTGSNGIGCSMYDACIHPDDTEEVAELFYTNFLKHYKTNRSPYLLSAHTAWYTLRPQRELAIKAFIKRALKLGDVWFVTIKQALQWMQSPTPNSRIMDFMPWQCEN